MSRLTDFIERRASDLKGNLTRIRDTPHAVAGGAAIGLLCGFTPLWGVKTLLAVGGAWACRCSKLAAALAVTFHDILLPIWPVVLRWQYQLGYWILWHRLPARFSFKHFNVENFLRPESLELYIWPTLIGSLIMAAPVAVVTYFVVLAVVQAANARK